MSDHGGGEPILRVAHAEDREDSLAADGGGMGNMPVVPVGGLIGVDFCVVMLPSDSDRD